MKKLVVVLILSAFAIMVIERSYAAEKAHVPKVEKMVTVDNAIVPAIDIVIERPGNEEVLILPLSNDPVSAFLHEVKPLGNGPPIVKDDKRVTIRADS